MTFQKYINHLPPSGILFKNIDDSESQELGFDGTTILYGLDPEAMVSASDIYVRNRRQFFESQGTRFELQIPGKFNISNALAAIAVARHLGIADSIIQQALKAFSGVWRRFEVLGTYRDAVVISDYAHHPTAIDSTMKAAREFYPGKRIIAVFQPHQRSRTKKLFKQFEQAFSGADFVIIQEIFDVAGREADEDSDISSEQLVTAVERTGKYVFYTPDAKATKKQIDDIVERDDILLIMGAGDIYQLAEALIQ